MIDPRTVMLAVPTYDYKVPAEAAGMWISCAGRFFHGLSLKGGISSVALARNLIAEQFLQSSYTWLVFQDADIVASPDDFRLLMEPMETAHDASISTVLCRQIDPAQPMGQSPYEDLADIIVSAEYSYKDDSLRPCRGGLGFTRIHRSVFEKIRELKHEDGTPRTYQCMYGGRLMCDYFPQGPFISQMIPNGEWKGEDVGFFTLASLAGIVPRWETRTRLWHVGTKAYPYTGGVESGAN